MTDVFFLLAPIILILLAWSALASFVFIRSPARYLMRWMLIPGSLLAAVVFGYFCSLSLGYAVPLEPPAEFDFLGYNVVVRDNQKVAIEIWVDGWRTRLYRIPYSKQAEEAMKEAAKKGQGGGVVHMERDEQGEGSSQAPPYQSNILTPSDLSPKVR